MTSIFFFSKISFLISFLIIHSNAQKQVKNDDSKPEITNNNNLDSKENNREECILLIKALINEDFNKTSQVLKQIAIKRGVELPPIALYNLCKQFIPNVLQTAMSFGIRVSGIVYGNRTSFSADTIPNSSIPEFNNLNWPMDT